jgi:glycosyltransferase involved in cell wall biosynthesis
VAVIPALNEEGAVGPTVRGVRPHVDVVVVADNGSQDATAARAEEAGAQVVHQPQRGYGAACHAGIVRARALGAQVLLFLDADGSEDPAEAPLLLSPIAAGEADLVLGVRRPHLVQPGAMSPPQRFGNWLAPMLMRRALGAPFTDMPPYKAIRMDALSRLDLRDRAHGFTIELLLEAHRVGLRVTEREVHCLRRTSGVSKVSGTVRGSVRAGVKILYAIGSHTLRTRLLAGSTGAC